MHLIVVRQVHLESDLLGDRHQSSASNSSSRSRTLFTCVGRCSVLPCSMIGINLSNSGPECDPVSATRTGWNRSMPFAPDLAFVSFMIALKRSAESKSDSLRANAANVRSTYIDC